MDEEIGPAIDDGVVEEVFRQYWQDIVMPNDEWDLEQVKKELHDYQQVMQEVSKVYTYITMNKISYPNTKADSVIGVYEDVLQDLIAEAVEEAKEEWEKEDE